MGGLGFCGWVWVTDDDEEIDLGYYIINFEGKIKQSGWLLFGPHLTLEDTFWDRGGGELSTIFTKSKTYVYLQ